MFKFSGSRPQRLGVVSGRFSAPTTGKPNWVSSMADAADRGHYIAPLPMAGTASQSMAKLRQVLDGLPRVRVVSATSDYLHAEFSSALMGYVDDVEFYCDGERLQVRSSSRLGYSDLGANRKRVESLRAALAA
ncbi:MAG TPA: DUF1499 domain-containing protein [Stenotrophobium sp.]|jgi:uncharacterized protein (DUF1499 family)|nr:DUF1499 domain-containing protein [Stenotrophobium sp.]